MDMHFEGIIFRTHADELGRRLGRAYPPFAVLDVRSAAAHERLRIPGSFRVDAPLETLPAGTDQTTELFVVGAHPGDARVRQAALALKGLGARRVVEVPGGLREWLGRGLPVEGIGTAA